jgi:hypothetical protein
MGEHSAQASCFDKLSMRRLGIILKREYSPILTLSLSKGEGFDQLASRETDGER